MTTTRRITVALAVGAFSLLPFSAAHAAEPAQSCWYNVDNDTMGCFDASLDPHEQIEFESGSELIAVPSGSQPRGTSTVSLAADVTYLLATGWDATGQTGASISYYTSNPLICNGVAHGFSNLGAWNNLFESLATYNGCEAYLYELQNYDGTEWGPILSSANLGAANNRAESLWVE